MYISMASGMQWTAVDDVEIRLYVDETGKSGVLCKKGEKVMMNDLCYGKQIWDYVDVNGLIDEFIELYKIDQ